MSASSVILRGYKGGTLVTRGYSVGAPVLPPAVTQVTSPDVSGHGEPNRLSPRELAELNVAEAFRNTTVPSKEQEPQVVILKPAKPVPSNVVSLDDYRPVSFEDMDAGIARLQDGLAQMLSDRLLRDMQDAQIIAEMNALDEELAITLLLLD